MIDGTALFEAMRDSVVVLDRQRRYLYANPVALAALGRTLDSILGLDYREIVHAAAGAPFDLAIDRVLEGSRHERAIGLSAMTGREYEFTIMPVGDHLVAFIRDVTEERLARHRSDDFAARYRALVDSTSVAVWLANDAGEIDSSPSFSALTGLTAEGSAGRGWTDGIHPDDLPAVNAAWAKAVAEGSIYELEFRVRAPAGGWQWVAARGVPLPHAPGEPRRWMGANTDISQRKRAEEALRTSEERLQAVIDSTPAAIYAKDLDARYILANRSLAEIVGKPVHEVLGTTDAELFAPEVAADLTRTDTEALGLGGALRVEHELNLLGQQRTFLTTKFPLKDASGELYAVGGISVDVTDFRAAEEKLRLSDRRKDEFLAMLGHELRNPLAPILTAVEILSARDGGEGNRELEIVGRQTRHLVRMVDDLLDVSRIERGKIQVRRANVSLGDVVGRALEMTSHLAAVRGIELELDVDHELRVDGDPDRLAQAVANLLSNAIKYSDPQKAVRTSARREGDEAVLTVEDRGIGIPPALVPHIFEPFVQGDSSLDRAHGGLGLGLSIVHGIAELHGGSVKAHSEGPGLGSRFEVRLPALPPGPAPAPVAPPAAPKIERRLRVLVVDDNADAAELLADFLSGEGFETRVALDGPEALLALPQFVPDIALLDIGLPAMSGYELAGRIRKLPGLERLRLVALTGYGQESDRRRSEEAGFDHHLVKPVEVDTLIQLLAELVDAAPR